MNRYLSLGIIFGLVGVSAQAAVTTFQCQAKDGNGQVYDYLKISYENSKIVDLTVGSYDLIQNSKSVDDQSVTAPFNIKVGELVHAGNGAVQLKVSLQDYSDKMSWWIALSEDSKEGAVISGFQSSDGDNQLHVSSVDLSCK